MTVATKAFRHLTGCGLGAALLLIAAEPSLYAQSNLTGTIRDTTSAVLPGAMVTATGSSLIGGSRTVVTDSTGVYRLFALPPGSYEVSADLIGFRSAKRVDVRLPVGTTLTVDFQLELTPLAERVEVGGTPVLDVKSPIASTHFDTDLLEHLPTTRDLQAVINLTPGVTSLVGFGGTQGSNALSVDGTTANEPALGGMFQGFNYNWVEEIQVASAAAAESPAFTGAIATVVLRSGGDRFSGLGEYRTSRPHWVSDNTGSLPTTLGERFKPRETLKSWDGSAQLGGPLYEQKLWFFTGGQYSREDSRPAGFTDGIQSDRNPKGIVKLTAALSTKLRAEGFYEHDAPGITGMGDPTFRPEARWLYLNPHSFWNARLTWTIDDRTTLEVRNGGHVAFQSRPIATALTLTKYATRLPGLTHELKVGFEYQRATARDEFGYPAGRGFYDDNGVPQLMYSGGSQVFDPTSRAVAIFVQDRWAIAEGLTVDSGIRFDANRGSVPDNRHAFSSNPLSPRIGVAWDLTKTHKAVLRAHFGRYHDALLTNNYQFLHISGQEPEVLSAVIGPDQFVEISRSDPQTAYAIDPHVSHSYVDQYTVGVERELFRDFSLQVQYIRKNFKNFMGFIDTGSIYAPVDRQDPGPDGRLGTSDEGSVVTIFNKTNPGHEFWLFTNPPAAFRNYSAFQVVGRKRYSRDWELLAAYTWSRNEGNVNNDLGSNTGFGDVGQRGAFVNPNRAINNTGHAAFDIPHEMKVLGTYRVPVWQGLTVSSVYRYYSGLAWGRVATFRGLSQGVETVRVEPRGTRRAAAVNTIDLRVEKTFYLKSVNRTVGIAIDAFNLNNQGAPNSRFRFAVVEASGPNFGLPNVWLNPRSLRAGVRVSF